MKHIDVEKKNRKSLKRSSISGIAISFVLWFIAVPLFGQDPGWENSYPKFELKDGATYFTKGLTNDNDYLTMKFTPNELISDPTVEINLPTGISYNGDYITGTEYDALQSKVNKVEIKSGKLIVSFMGDLVANKTVHIHLKLKAGINADSEKELQTAVQVKTGTNDAGNAKTIPTIVVEPMLMGAFEIGQDIEQDTETAIGYQVKSIGGETSSLTVTFTTSEYVLLSNFMVEGNKIESEDLFVSEPDNGLVTYILKLNESLMKGRVDEEGKMIDMNVRLLRCGMNEIRHFITVFGKDLLASNQQITVAGGTTRPTMIHKSTLYLKNHSKDNPNANENYPSSRNSYYPPMDGTGTWVRSIFTNDSEASAYGIRVNMRRYSYYTYLDIKNEKPYYVIRKENGDILFKDDLINVQKSGSVINDSKYGEFSQYLDEPTGMIGDIKNEHYIPARGSIEFFVITYNGSIYDTPDKDLFYDYWTTVNAGFVTNIQKVTNPCGDAGYFDTANNRLTYTGVPHFREMPTGLSFRDVEEKEVDLRISTGNLLTGIANMVLNINEIPSWLNIKSAEIISLDKQSALTTGVRSESENKVSFTFSDNYGEVSNCYIRLIMESDDTDITENKEEILKYNIDYNYLLSNTSMKNVYRVSQPITLMVDEEGVTLDSFTLKRITTGQIEDTQKDIRHDYYMPGDIGEFVWEATIQDDGYKYIYFPYKASCDELAGSINVTGETEITINGTEILQPQVSVSGSLLSFHYEDGFKKDDVITVTTGFKAGTGLNRKESFSSKCFVSKTEISNPEEDKTNDGRVGKNMKYTDCSIFVLEIDHFWSKTNHSFMDENPVNIDYFYFDTFHSSKLFEPYFSNEIRVFAWPKKIEIIAPLGYEVTELYFQKASSDARWDNNISIENKTKLTPSKITEGTTTITYEFDLISLYNANPNDYDDRWMQSARAVIKASPSAKKGTITSYVTLDTYTGEEKRIQASGGYRLQADYKGLSVGLTAPSEAAVTSLEVTLSGIQLKNTGSGTIKDTWLYVKGNIKDLRIGDTQGNGNWIKVSDDLVVDKSELCNLSFTFTGKSDETITLYALSGYNDALVPSGDISNYLSKVGETKNIKLNVASTRINGLLTVDNAVLSYSEEADQDLYTVTATLTGQFSYGDVVNPEMIIEVPKGQSLVGAKLTYGNTIIEKDANAADINTLFPGIKTHVETGGNFTFNLAKALGKDNVNLRGVFNTGTDPQVATLDITYKPVCGTESSGIRFRGTIKAESPFDGGTVIGYGNKVGTVTMYTDADSPYKFAIVTDIKDSNSQSNFAFNEISNTAQLEVSLSLLRQNQVGSNDLLWLVLPEYLSIVGDITWESKEGASLTVFNMETDLQKDTQNNSLYKLTVPQDAFNINLNDVVTYKIPVIYSKPTDEAALDALSSTPVSTIYLDVMTKAVPFGGEDCGEDETDLSIGADTKQVAFILTDQDLPYTAFIDNTSSIEVISNQFDGKWNVNGLEFDGATCNFKPTAPIYTNTLVGENGLLVPVTILVSFEGKSFGNVSAGFRVYPSLTYQLVDDFVSCQALEDVDLQTYVSSIEAGDQGTIVSFYDAEECDGEPITGLVDMINEGIYTYWTKSSNKGGDAKQDPKSITVTINVPVTVSTPVDKSNSDLEYEFGSTVKLEVIATGSGNPNLSFQWYKDGEPLNGKTSASLEINNAGKSDSGEYYVRVTGYCNAVNSTAVTVTVHSDLTFELESDRTTICDTEGLNLYGFIKEAKAGTSYHYALNADGDDLEELLSGILQNPVKGNYYVYAKSGDKLSTPQALDVTIDHPAQITTDLPASMTYYIGTTRQMVIVATGTDLNYQWYKDGVKIDSETTNMLILKDIKEEDAGLYYVEVISEGVCANSVMSKTQEVKVIRQSIPSTEVYRVTYEANWDGKISVIYNGNWSINSGDYVDWGTRLSVSVSPGMPGLILESLTVNGTEIENGDIITINSDTHIVATFELDGSDPNPDPDPTGNTEVVSSVDIRTERGYLCIRSEKAGQVRVINFAGRTYADCAMIEGETSIPLPSGFYIVLLSDGTTKKIVIRE